jgi:hypothetical protein
MSEEKLCGFASDSKDTILEMINDLEKNLLYELRDLRDNKTGVLENPEAQRWLSIAKTHFEEGFMALRKALYPSRY